VTNKSEIAVAITGSPNTVTDITFDVRSTHLRTPLLGTLLSLGVPVQIGNGNSEELLVLGQVASVEMKNRWHEDPALKNYIKLHGRLPHLTEIGDTTTGRLQIVGAYRTIASEDSSRYEKTRLAVPPGSGLGINQVDGDVIKKIMSQDFGYAYLGNFYGTNDVPAPVYVRHFGDFKKLGSGEAYMGGVFGPSGSGKSVIAATLIALWAHNPTMGVLILDPQSEFSENAFARGTGFDFNFHNILRETSQNRFDPQKHIIRLDQLQLEGTEMFVQVLDEKGFFKTLGLSKRNNIDDAMENVTRLLDDLKDEQKIWDTTMDWDAVQQLNVNTAPRRGGAQQQITLTPFPNAFTDEAANAYAASSRPAKAQEFLQSWQNQGRNLSRIWNETVTLFSPRSPKGESRFNVLQVLRDTILNGHVRILDLNPQTIQLGQDFKLYLMDFVFRKLRQISYAYYRDDNPGNCLIVLDEAGRYIPQDVGDNDRVRNLCRSLTNSVKEMRKMRCGFMFITQTIAEIQKEIFRNLHFRIYGVGLGVGADADHIKAREGDDAFELYKSLPDPRLSKTFSFMVAGVLLALGSSGRPMVIEGFPSGQAVLDANTHLLNKQPPLLSNIGQVVTK
jgi:DNA helicase HerA-like ATPase